MRSSEQTFVRRSQLWGYNLRQRHKELSYRLLRCLVLQALIERYNVALDNREEQLESRLEALDASLEAPNQIKVLLHELWSFFLTF